MVEATQDEKYDNFLYNFSNVISTNLGSLTNLLSLGRSRVEVRNELTALKRNAELQLEVEYQIKLFQSIGKGFVKVKEHELAQECYSHIIENLSSRVEENVTRVTLHTEAVYAKAISKYSELNDSTGSRTAPIVVSKMVKSLRDLHKALIDIFDMSVSNQEELSWLILNGCKLILKLAQPLVWVSCGKYVADVLLFAALCMESVVNLCTTRHLKFRMKLYITVFYNAVVYGSEDDSQRYLAHVVDQITNLRAQEELDLPVPDKTEHALLEAEVDIATMKAILSMWVSPDRFSTMSDENALMGEYRHPGVGAEDGSMKASVGRFFRERVLAEYVRVQQLTSGNRNEVWRRRCVGVMSGFRVYFETVKLESNAAAAAEEELPPAEEDDTAAPEPDAELAGGDDEETFPPVVEKREEAQMRLLRNCVIELLSMNLFCPKKKEEEDDDIKIDSDTQKAVLEYAVDNVVRSYDSSELKAGHSYMTMMESLLELSRMESRESEEFMHGTFKFVQTLDECISTENAKLKKSVLIQVAVNLWEDYVSPSLQKSLSDQANPSAGTLKFIGPALLCLFKVFNSTQVDDSVMLGSMSLLVGKVFSQFHDYRTAITVLSRALDNMDKQRAARVDLRLHAPVDSSDISALQHSSFTSQNDAQDWFNSIKRLGAHAFAGFGIFGSASVAERTDHALAELHTDLMMLYLRCEVQYAMSRKRTKKALKYYKHDKKFYEKHTHDRVKFSHKTSEEKLSMDPAMPISTSFVPPLENDGDAGSLDVEYKTNTDNLRIKNVLKSWCVENTQALALLYSELAQVDSRPANQIKLVEAAKALVDESEKCENELKQSQAGLTVLSATGFRAPIALARSHSFVYAIPVASQKHENQAEYYRLYAKEDLHGSLVTFANDDVAGSESMVAMTTYRKRDAVQNCSVRLGHLRWGKKYVFASVAFNGQGKTVGKIGPTSIAVEAKNPLSNVMLWFQIYQVASGVSTPTETSLELAEYAAVQICNFYFFPTRNAAEPKPFTLGKGKNVFVGTDVVLSMLKVQLSSNVQLVTFIEAFLYLVEREDKYVPSRVRRNAQSHLISHLRTVSRVSLLAVYCGAYDLAARCVSLGHSLASSLLFADEVNIASELQNPMMQLVVALQSTPKKNWEILEHKLYCRLLSSLVRVAVVNRNVAPVLDIVDNTFAEEVDDHLLKFLKDEKQRSEVELDYFGLQSTLWKKRAMLSAVSGDEKDVVKPFEYIMKAPVTGESEEEKAPEDLFFESSISRRAFVILQEGDAALTAASSSVLPYLASTSQSASTLLFAALQMVKLVASSGSDGKDETFAKIFESVKIPKAKVATGVQQLMTEWSINLFEMTEPESEEEPEPEPAEGEEEVAPVKAPEPVSEEEEKKQLLFLAEICFLQAQFCLHPKMSSSRNFKPVGSKGPDDIVDITGGSPLIETMVPSSEEKGEDGVGGDGADQEGDAASFAPYIQNLCCSIIMFAQAGYSSSGVHVVVTLWNHIVEYWVSPEDFARKYGKIKEFLPHLSSSVASLLTACVVDNVPEEHIATRASSKEMTKANETAVDSNATGAVQAIHIENSREYLYCCQEFILYVVKVHWLFEQFADLVSASSQCLSVFLHSENPDLVKVIGEQCSPICIEAQNRIVQGVEDQLAGVNMRMTTCVETFAASMKLKRRKKKRLTSNEKDDDELAHEEEVDEINSEIATVQGVLDNEKDRLAGLMALQKRYEGTLSTGLQLMYKVSANQREFVVKFHADKESRGEATEMAASNAPINAMSAAVRDSFDDLMDEYQQLSDFLREKQDRMTLVNALTDQGNVILLCGFIESARKVFHDSLDGYFNVMDAYKDYDGIVATEVQKMSSDGDGTSIKGLIYSVMALGKLSKYCSTNDWDSKIHYCRFAADLCRVPFLESYGHPLSCVGFAAYVCTELGGLASFMLETDRAFIFNLAVALVEVVDVLLLCDLRIEALPVVVFLEHIHLTYTRRVDLWLSARVMRVKILLASHLFAEAASMIASVKSSLCAILDLDIEMDEDEAIVGHRNDTRENVLDFFGLDPFYNHLLPSSEENQKALAWVETFPVDIRAFVAEEEEKINAKAPVPAVEGEDRAGKTRLISSQLLDEVSSLSARFFIELSGLENNVQAEHAAALLELSSRGNVLVEAIVGDKDVAPEVEALNDGSWISLRSTLVLMKVDTMIQQRKYMPARHLLLNLVELLKLDQGSRDQEKKTLVWFSVRDRLAELAERQARWRDAIAIATQGIVETSVANCSTWTRRLTFRRAYSSYQLGDFEQCMADCESVCVSFEEQSYTDGLYLRTLVLKAAIIMDFASSNINGISGPLRDVSASIKSLEKARELAENVCSIAGYLGADSNVTFFDVEDNVTKSTYFSPILHNLTDVQENAQNLFVNRTKSLNGYSKNEADVANHGDDPITGGVEPFRLGPIDEGGEEMVTKSKYANIYLVETRNLAACLSALVVAYSNFDSFADHKALDASSLPDTDESGLKVMRCVPYVSPQIRSSMLQSVGHTRPLRTMGTRKTTDEDISPLLVSLTVAIKNFHDWNSMRSTCVRAVDLLEGSMDSNNAIKFVQTAVKLKNKFKVVEKDPLAVLNEDASFAANAVDDNLSNLIKTAALTAPNLEARSVSGPADSAYKVCGADAVFLLSSMLREFDSLWLDAPIRSTYYDICSILGKSSAVFKEKCLIGEVPSTTDDSKASVPDGSLSTLWVQSVDTTAEAPDTAYSQDFAHVMAYFLMGAPADGDGSPDLRKKVFARTELDTAKKSILKLRRDMIRLAGEEGSTAQQFAEAARIIVSQLSGSVVATAGQGEGQKNKPAISVTQSEDASCVVLELKGGSLGTITVDEAFLLALADVFSIDKDLEAIENEDIYKFVTTVLD